MMNVAKKHSLPPFSKFIESLPESNQDQKLYETFPSSPDTRLHHYRQASDPTIGGHVGSISSLTNGTCSHSNEYINNDLQQQLNNFSPNRYGHNYVNYTHSYERGHNTQNDSYPVNYQFPPTSYLQNMVKSSGDVYINGNISQENTSGLEQTMMEFNRLVSTSNDVIDGLNLLNSVYNKFVLENDTSPKTSGSPYAIHNKSKSTHSLKSMLLSVPSSILNSLEFYSGQHQKLLHNLKLAQTTYLGELEREANHLSSSSVYSLPFFQPQSRLPSPTVINNSGSESSHPSFMTEVSHRHSQSNSKIKRYLNSYSNISSTNNSHSFQPLQQPRLIVKSPLREPKRLDHHHNHPATKPKARSSNGVHIQPKKSSGTQSKRGNVLKFDSLRRKPPSPVSCAHCGSSKTPEWRRGPSGDKTLCNACGIFFSKLIKKYHSPMEAARVMKERKEKGQKLDRHV